MQNQAQITLAHSKENSSKIKHRHKIKDNIPHSPADATFNHSAEHVEVELLWPQ